MKLEATNYTVRMAAFLLVHGVWQSAGTWDLLRPLLESAGHSVTAQVLSGLGADQSRLSPDTSLHQHIADVAGTLSKTGEPPILVGHSYAGMVVTGAAEASPGRIGKLVYVDAFIPEDGQSALDLLPAAAGACPGRRATRSVGPREGQRGPRVRADPAVRFQLAMF
jgi:pimeloyl-ACP methyl ester carboxylesterase